jgi:hypothetical protein
MFVITVTLHMGQTHNYDVGSFRPCWVHLNPCKLAIKDFCLSRNDRVMVKPDTCRAFYGVASPRKESRVCLLYTVTIHMVHTHHHEVGSFRPCWVHINSSSLTIKGGSVSDFNAVTGGGTHTFRASYGFTGAQKEARLCLLYTVTIYVVHKYHHENHSISYMWGT